jgi:hypothetical protein
MSDKDRESGSLVSASCPGGMARQFRVQVSSGDTPSSWTLVGSFRDSRQARECAARIQNAGQKARVVACHALPTAA